MDPSALKTVLITGASTGVGLALSQRLLPQKEYRLVLTARASSLGRFAQQGIQESERIFLRPLDVTDPIQRKQCIEEINESWGGVDILINNAGVAFRAVFEHATEQDILEQMDINFRSPVALARLVLPSMRKKQRGHILNISSAAGMMAMPTMGAYSASKFALEGITEALWYEARPWGIKVSLIEPGFIHSSAFEGVRFTEESCRSLRDGTEAYSAYYRYMEPFIAKMMKKTWSTPDHVASLIERTVKKKNPPLRVPATWDVWLFSFMRRFLPQLFYPKNEREGSHHNP